MLELAADVAGVGFRPCTTAVLCDMPCRGIHNANAAGRMTAAATARAPLIWSALQPQNAQGAAYLAGRGIAPLPVGTVRHCSDGTVAIPLRDSNGSVINVIRRRIDGGTPRVDGMWHASSQGTLVGCLSDVSASGGPVYVCEGATDTLAAKVLWPRSTVLGAHYPGNMPGVGAAVGTLLAGTDRALVVVPDKDSVGLRAGEATVRAAIEAGMSPDHVHTHCVKAGDLADDLQAAVRT